MKTVPDTVGTHTNTPNPCQIILLSGVGPEACSCIWLGKRSKYDYFAILYQQRKEWIKWKVNCLFSFFPLQLYTSQRLHRKVAAQALSLLVSITTCFFFLRVFFFFFFWSHCTTCGILVPQPEIKPVPPAVEVWSPNHWTVREVPPYHFLTHTLSKRLLGIT